MTDKAYRLDSATSLLKKAEDEINSFRFVLRQYEDGNWTDAGLLDQTNGRLKGIALQALKEAIDDINAAMEG